LRRTQNPDGGWGYFPGKQSWAEPTAYAAMALHGEPAADRAWRLLKSWRRPDGSYRPCTTVDIASWVTSLCITVAIARDEWSDSLKQSVHWLLGNAGAESDWWKVALHRLGLVKMDRDISLKAWPWKPDDSSWVEPTSHALVALKQASVRYDSGSLRERVGAGEAQLMDVRAEDGGWNYGNRVALGMVLPSYPETTALALIGLQGRNDLGKAFDTAKRMLSQTPSPLARAWLAIAMRLHGMEAPEASGDLTGDCMITAVEALAARQGNYWFMSTARGAQPPNTPRGGRTA
jgi:hypothetical protein